MTHALARKRVHIAGDKSGLHPLQQRALTQLIDKARRADGLHFIRLGNGWLLTAQRRGRGPFAPMHWRIEDHFRNLIASGEN